jgi:hypothetical protein
MTDDDPMQHLETSAATGRCSSTQKPATASVSRGLFSMTDGKREYAYGPAAGLPNTKVGTFPQSLMNEAKKNGWIVVSMNNDWNRIFAFGK